MYDSLAEQGGNKMACGLEGRVCSMLMGTLSVVRVKVRAHLDQVRLLQEPGTQGHGGACGALGLGCDRVEAAYATGSEQVRVWLAENDSTSTCQHTPDLNLTLEP